jgi:hypothetical protein
MWIVWIMMSINEPTMVFFKCDLMIRWNMNLLSECMELPHRKRDLTNINWDLPSQIWVLTNKHRELASNSGDLQRKIGVHQQPLKYVEQILLNLRVRGAAWWFYCIIGDYRHEESEMA